MATTEERTKLRAEFARLGVVGDFLEPAQPKYDYYRHKPQLNISGKVMQPVNSMAPNNPAAPDTVARLAYRGLFPYPCGPDCTCPWAKARDWSLAELQPDGTYTEPDEVRYTITAVVSPQRIKALEEQRERAEVRAKKREAEAEVHGLFVATCTRCGWENNELSDQGGVNRALGAHNRWKHPKVGKKRVKQVEPEPALEPAMAAQGEE